MSNHKCVGTSFERWDKKWAWCCRDGALYELKDPEQKFCFKCERFWDPITIDEHEMKRIFGYVEYQIDLPFYRKFYEDHYQELLDLRDMVDKADLETFKRIVKKLKEKPCPSKPNNSPA